MLLCTRVQFALSSCPKGSVYGRVSAISSLLDGPLWGPVLLRSSDHKLPDVVVLLRGPAQQPVRVEVVGRIDSVKGRLRVRFEDVPDVPVSKVVVGMQGGRKGLIVNSRNLCASKNRAGVKLVGQNGRRAVLRPVVRAVGCKKQRKGKRKARRSAHRRR